MRRLVWVHVGRKPIMLVLSWRGSYVVLLKQHVSRCTFQTAPTTNVNYKKEVKMCKINTVEILWKFLKNWPSIANNMKIITFIFSLFTFYKTSIHFFQVLFSWNILAYLEACSFKIGIYKIHFYFFLKSYKKLIFEFKACNLCLFWCKVIILCEFC
jgi:hypothetical protein